MMFTSRQKSLLVVTLLALALLIPAVALAQGGGEGQQPPVTDDDVNRLSSQLYCPVCENVPLDVCPTAACERWRAQVRTLLEDGASDQEVINYFVEQFGQRVVGFPQDPTLAFLAVFVPAVAAVIGLSLASWYVVRWRRNNRLLQQQMQAASGEAVSDDYRSRLERELRNLDV